MSEIIKISEFNPKNIKYEKMKTRGIGSKNVRMTYNGRPIVLQIPNARVPFGLNIFNLEDNTKKYSLEITIKGTDPLDISHDILKEIDESNIMYCLENSKKLVGKELTRERLEDAEIYNSIVKQDEEKKYPPRFKMRLPVYDNKPDFAVYNKDRKHIELSSVIDGERTLNWDWAQYGMEIISIIECKGLWVVNKKVYCSWNLVQLKITRNSGRISGYAFIEDEETQEISEKENDECDIDEEEEVQYESNTIKELQDMTLTQSQPPEISENVVIEEEDEEISEDDSIDG